MDEGGDGDGGMQADEHVYVVGHSVDAIEHTLVVFAETVDVHVEFAFVFLNNDGGIAVGAEDDVVYQFRVCHVLCRWGTPLGCMFFSFIVNP